VQKGRELNKAKKEYGVKLDNLDFSLILIWSLMRSDVWQKHLCSSWSHSYVIFKCSFNSGTESLPVQGFLKNFFFSTGAWTQGLHLESTHQLFSVIFFSVIGSPGTIWLGLAWNQDPPDLCLLSSQDYRREPPAPH
jgi:hypothetical protein